MDSGKYDRRVGPRGSSARISSVRLAGVFNGIDFLINVNLGYEIELDKLVAVVGGGNVAIEVARAAVRPVHKTAEFPESVDAWELK